ncbi:MAG: hypothetical protein HFE97_07800 [Oscillospiraceae bacterium]|nr:hypothetical protein [Oscillospiraceae bacterium]
MREFLKSMKITFLLAAILYVLLGLVLLVWTDTTLAVLCTVFGSVLLVYGAVTIVGFFLHDSALGTFRLELLLGILAGALGVLFLLRPVFLLSIVPVILGVYIAIDSLVNLKRALELYRLEYPRWWTALLLAVLGAVLGGVILLNPFQTQILLFQIIGVSFIYTGLSDLWVLFKISRLTKELRKRAPIQVDPINID